MQTNYILFCQRGWKLKNKKIWGPIIAGALFAVILIFDLLSKEFAFQALQNEGDSANFIPGFINFVHVKNKGGAWGIFSNNGVKIRTLFSKNNWMMYENCHSCGIGFYTHGILNSKTGSKVYFIFLSSDVFEESYRQKINLWKPSQTRIKVQFDKKLYDYLLAVLPKKQAKMLLGDYQKYFR